MQRPANWNAFRCGAPQARRYDRDSPLITRGDRESVIARIQAIGILHLFTAAAHFAGNAANGRVLECVAGTAASERVDSSFALIVGDISL